MEGAWEDDANNLDSFLEEEARMRVNWGVDGITDLGVSFLLQATLNDGGVPLVALYNHKKRKPSKRAYTHIWFRIGFNWRPLMLTPD